MTDLQQQRYQTTREEFKRGVQTYSKFEVESLFAEIERLTEEIVRSHQSLNDEFSTSEHCFCSICTEYRTLSNATVSD
jgi:signal transduction histidine kinase